MLKLTAKLSKACLAALLALALGAGEALADVAVDAANFPDSHFRQWVKENAAQGGDVLTDAQIAQVEEMDVSQTNLVIGWRLGECMEDPDFAALYVFNDLFGGSPSSKLFLNVREKLSLCYYASSIIDIRKGLLLVSSGIQLANLDAAKAEIFAQLDAVCRGDFSEDELQTAKAGVISDLRSIPDSQGALESFYLSQAVVGADYSPTDLAALVNEVTAAQVIAIAKSVECDQIYLLKQESDPEDEHDDAEI